MNKKTGFKPSTLIIMIYVICAFFLGAMFGAAMMLSSAAFLLQQINVDKIDVSFNETEAINAFYDRVKEDGLKPGWIDIETKDKIVETTPIYKFNLTENNVTVYKYNQTTGNFSQCCYPVECGELNPPKCDCIYPVKCEKIENMGPFNHPARYL